VRGDIRGAYEHIAALYETSGIEISDLLVLREQSAFELLSFYAVGETITQSRLLAEGEGYRYWSNWSRETTGGAWNPEQAFPTEEQARMVGNFAIAGILAHEMGHYVCGVQGFDRWGTSFRELLADELCIRMMNVWATCPELAELRGLYLEHVVRGMRRAVPAGTRIDLDVGLDLDDLREFCREFSLPSEVSVAGYVSFQLARQEVLLTHAGIDTLAEFHRSELSRLPERVWHCEQVSLTTVEVDAVPAWMRVTGSPAKLWEVDPGSLATAAATALALPTLDLTAGDEDPVWQLAGPRSAYLLLTREDLWGERAVRLLRFEFEERGQPTATVLGGSGVLPGVWSWLATEDGTVTYLTLDFDDEGLLYRRLMPTPGGADLVPASLDGMVGERSAADGPLDQMPLVVGDRAFLGVSDGLLVSLEGEIKVIGDGRMTTLIGGIENCRDGTDPRRVRIADAELLGFAEGALFLRTASKEGAIYRKLAW